MIDPAHLDVLERHDCSVIAGILTPEGEPFATRCWGIRAVSHDPLQLRVLLPAGALARIGRLAGDGSSFPIAVTSADVVTLAAVQAKGTAHDLEPPTDEDLERFAVYTATFFDRINRTDGYDPALLARWAPADLVACTVDVRDLFDQTPGPGAGARLTGSSA